MREIKFRGYGKDAKRWIYGSLLDERSVGIVAIQDDNCHVWAVEPESVGQFTGLYDCDGHEIYEGDVVAFGDFRKAHGIENEYWHDVVKWDNKHARFILDTLFFDDVFSNELLIIGNVYDNPELLEVEHDRRD